MPAAETILVGSYDFRLVLLSVVIAICASYAALDLAGRVTAAKGKARAIWLAGGAVAMGLGIWSMHYIGMLAFRLPVLVEYDWPTVLASLFAAILASAIALYVVSRKKLHVWNAVVGSIFMGIGIAAMHYIGMEAMRMSAMCHYSTGIVALSVALAIAISLVALWLVFLSREEAKAIAWRKIASALVMGAAIPVMHYTGMAAASFTASGMIPDFSHAVSISALGTAGITMVTLVVLGLATLTSIVDRQYSSQALQLASTEQRYRLLFERSLAGVYRITLDGRILDCNDACARILGHRFRAEVLANPVFATYSSPDDLAEFVTRLRKENSLTNFERRLIRKDGQPVWVLENTNLLQGEGRAAGEWIEGTLFDITERKQAEAELQRAKEAAEAGSRAKSEFLANMSHEIRTPMNGIIGMTELALETQLTPEQQEYLNMVKTSADSLLTIINDILDFSKIEAGKLELDNTTFALRDHLEEITKSFAIGAAAKGLELVCDFRHDVPYDVVGDPTRLRQVVVNLLGNAIKFTDRGEVVLHVEAERTTERDILLHFAIQDTGIGISTDKQKLIFEAFAQADSSSRRKYGGTGLGLTISSRLVEMMGGRIWVESEAGQGSTFHFTAGFALPQKLLPRKEHTSPVTLEGIHALVVDDNPTNRRILERTLLQWKMKPTLADSGWAALAALKKAKELGDPVRLLLLDAQMPGMDGFSLAAKIQNSDLPASTVMMLTSGGQRGDAARCREVGISGYLTKPVRQFELREAILNVLGMKQEKNEEPKLVTRHSLREGRRHLRVLLAEDNAINRELAVRLLTKRGHTVVVAENGRQACAAVESEAFDVVLMDVQMPEMDGFEATAAIRNAERLNGKHIPIVAMTAHAMKGDRERCLAAGMDAYVSKPVQFEELLKVTESFSDDDIPEAAEPEKVWEQDIALARVGGDEVLLADLARIFCDESPRLLAAVQQAIVNKSLVDLKRAAHSLRSAIATFSAQDATTTAASLEEFSPSDDISQAIEIYESLQANVAKLTQALEAFAGKQPVESAPSPVHGR